jgi:DNA-binding response OmpR family regulator
LLELLFTIIVPKCCTEFIQNLFITLSLVKLLIIEDEQGLRESIAAYFTESGNVCELASDYAIAREKINLYRYDCVLLDITLPGGTGLALLEILKNNNYPDGVLIISAKSSLEDKLNGLDLGADDYLTKPFHLSELRARVTAIIRRKSFGGNKLLKLNEISIDLQAKVVQVHDNILKLTRKEYALLLYFMVNKGKIVSKNAIAEHLWGDEFDVVDNFDFIYSHIKNLRKKLTESGSKDYIQAAYGMGYKFTDL